ncbi:protein LEAD-SENSITIVE 1-like [Panicum virgatum]|uniref:LRAT domain-containing protein n=1 Tax=Panicum virgatum TaxID=38727 RepID=A0A8T0W1W1_PANVG|nr:protein LEAD-SENSITIVE 1-like [Panicum virgatum]KAG2640647.1 hypothetical protein PVAP13_2KG113400 [Panicum virgatum]
MDRITWYSSCIERWQLKRGDHIYCWRTRAGYSYSHHGIYESDQKVIQYCSASTFSSSSSSRQAGSNGSSALYPTSLFQIPLALSAMTQAQRTCIACREAERDGGVVISCLDCFTEGDNICLFVYSVPRWFRNVWLIGSPTQHTCLVEDEDPPETVLRRANNLLANHGDFSVDSYNFVTNNCQHFAIYSKTGRKLSRFN